MTQSTSGWTEHRTRQLTLDTWLAREDALAAAVEDGGVVSIADLADPAHGADGTEREAMLRATFQRWTTTWEGVMHLRIELGDAPVEAINVAQVRTAELRDAEWRTICRAGDTAVMADLRRRQVARVARATGLSGPALQQAYAAAERRTAYVVPVALRVRRERRLRRLVLARRAV